MAGPDAGAETLPSGGGNALQADATEAYRRSPYPSMIHPQTHPDRMAVIARLAGMEPPPVETARVLEVGTGDALNLLSLAQAHPRANFAGFDIEAEGIARGRQRAAAVGLTNVQLEVADLMDGAPAIEGAFDYIIAHGLYAWVPQPVADALMALIRDRLSPNGVAFVSFNALPGCYARMPARDAMRRACEGVTDGAERLRLAEAALRGIVDYKGREDAGQAGLRAVAKTKLTGSTGVMLHDELGEHWRPLYLRTALEHAAAHDLAFLGDASTDQVLEAVYTGDAPVADVQRHLEEEAQSGDERALRLFRRLLLVRKDAAPTRRLDPRVIEALYAASYAVEVQPHVFVLEGTKIRCEHPPLVAMLRQLIAATPDRTPLSAFGFDDDLLRAVVGLFDCDILSLHTGPAACTGIVPDRPRASPLARAMVANGMDWAANLDNRVISLREASIATQILPLLDGDHDRAAVCEAVGPEGEATLARLAKLGLVLA